ncbi:hypothetical protein PT974_09723 [Cladobotryum mycophilum]|uniref:Uncharacterized protein n=1 Tax=Cladobotryum mycophilum TaxID=491253 RepID=A0ABR0SHZ5_9HYPO
MRIVNEDTFNASIRTTPKLYETANDPRPFSMLSTFPTAATPAEDEKNGVVTQEESICYLPKPNFFEPCQSSLSAGEISSSPQPLASSLPTSSVRGVGPGEKTVNQTVLSFLDESRMLIYPFQLFRVLADL